VSLQEDRSVAKCVQLLELSAILLQRNCSEYENGPESNREEPSILKEAEK